MRSTWLVLATLAVAAPMQAQDYRFTKAMAAGDRLQVSNINGDIEVTRGRSGTAEVVVTKTVKKGDGALVKAIMETGRNGVIRICTIYLNRDRNRDTCNGENNNFDNNSRRGDRDQLEVDMHYEVRLPAGVMLSADNVNGDVNITGVDADAKVETVNGDITFDGAAGSSLQTVNGSIHGTIARGDWDGSMKVGTVNGNIDLSFPAGLNADVRGETVNGSIRSPDFPMTIEGKWGPKSFSGRIGRGGSRLSIETVNGSITLRQAGRSRNPRDERDDKNSRNDRDHDTQEYSAQHAGELAKAISKSINKSIDKSVDQSIDQSISKTIDEAINKALEKAHEKTHEKMKIKHN